jgi:glycosyltransferase involved in cell wall biosynthesis
MAGDKFLGLDLAAHYLPDCTGQLDAWRDNGATVHCVVYDLLPLSRPDWFEDSTRFHFERWLDAITGHADQALCISETVAQDLRRRIAGTAAYQRLAIGRLHLSGDIDGSLPSTGCSASVAAVLERARSRPAILMIGTVEPRKAYSRALDAFERLWASAGQSAPDLIIVGKRGWKTATLQDRIRNHPQQGHRLHWLEEVSDEALTSLYEASTGLLLASYDEGFGLPLVEAAMHRCWALARDLPVYREQRLPNVTYFSDDSPAALSSELLDLVSRSDRGSPPAVSSPNWEWCVSRLLEEIGLGAATALRAPPKLRIAS